MEWYEVGRFLGPNIEQFYARWPLERQVELWRSAGISAVRVRRMSVGGGVVFSGVRDG
jgi:transposase